jgi:hypothetical protein
VAAEERSTEREERARDHVLAFVVSLFSARRSAQCRCLRSLSPRPKHLVASPLPLSRRIQSSLRLVAAARVRTVPRACANRTSPRSRCLRRIVVEDGRGPGWARRRSAFVRISTRAACLNSWSSSCVPSIRREQSKRTYRRQLSRSSRPSIRGMKRCSCVISALINIYHV